MRESGKVMRIHKKFPSNGMKRSLNVGHRGMEDILYSLNKSVNHEDSFSINTKKHYIKLTNENNPYKFRKIYTTGRHEHNKTKKNIRDYQEFINSFFDIDKDIDKEKIEDKIFIYPILISKDKETSEVPLFVEIPDFDGYTQGSNLANAIEMARDYIGNMMIEYEASGIKFPIPYSKKLEKEDGDIETLVDIDYQHFKIMNDQHPIKKTLTIPSYLNELGMKAGFNFSGSLTEALKQKLGI